MSEEIQIVVKEERQGNALAEEQQRLRQLQAEIQKQHGVTPEFALKLAQRRVEAEKGNPAMEERRKQSAAYVLAKEAAITEEKRKQATLDGGGGVTPGGGGGGGRVTLGGGAPTGGLVAGKAIGSAIGIAVGAAVSEALVEYEARQSMGNRDVAQRAMNERNLRISARSGNSGTALAEERATEARIFDRQQNRPELEHQAKVGWRQQALIGAGGGGVTGALIGSAIPGIGTAVGAAAGTVIGGVAGAYRGWRQGNLPLEEDDKGQARDKDLLAKQRKETRRQFEEGEGGLELQIARDRGRHSAQGNRSESEHKRELNFVREYHRLRDLGATQEEAKESGDLKVKEEEREMGLRASSGLVDARSGAGDISRASSIAQNAMGDTGAVHARIDARYAAMAGAENAVNAPVVNQPAGGATGGDHRSSIEAMHAGLARLLGSLVEQAGRRHFTE